MFHTPKSSCFGSERSRHRWLFEQALYNDFRDRTDKNLDYGRRYLQPGEMVHIRSRITNHYLGEAGDEKSLIDQESEGPL